LLIQAFSAQYGDGASGLKESDEIIKIIRKKYVPMYKKYNGVISTRNINIKEIDPETDKVVGRSFLSLIRKDYFYKEPEIKVLQYIKNGRKMLESDYKPKKSKPSYRIFDEYGFKNYKTTVVGFKNIKGRRCYKIKILPRENTLRHFKGFLYCAVSDLSILLIEGTLGNTPFPLKEFRIKFFLDHIDDLAVIKSGIVVMRVYIPVILPDRRYISNIQATDNRPMFK